MLNSINFISGLNATRRVQLWRFDNKISELWAHFHCRNGYLGASGQKFDLAIRFGDPDFLLQGNNSSVGIHFCYILAISLVRMHRNSINSASSLKTALTTVVVDRDFL